MESVQLASALSVHLIPAVGAAGMAWLRLSAGAVIFLVVGRPPFRALRLHDLPALLGLGVTTYGPSCSSRRSSSIPLGTAVAVEFLDPLTVIAVRFRSGGVSPGSQLSSAESCWSLNLGAAQSPSPARDAVALRCSRPRAHPIESLGNVTLVNLRAADDAPTIPCRDASEYRGAPRP